MSVFNTAGNRAIMIGIALGIVATSLKILLAWIVRISARTERWAIS